MKKIFLLLFCVCAFLHSFAQYYTNRNNVWTFGYHAGINFNSGSPVPINTNLYTREGCASVCNTSGNLLFYTDGNKVFNRLGALMPGGVLPFFTNSTTQGALIVPFINDSTKYYVFSLEADNGTKLAYSIIDMTLAGGLGDIVTGSSGVILDTSMSEKMIAIPGNSCNVWVLTVKRNSAEFWAFEITSSGVNSTPVISHTGWVIGSPSSAIGVIKCSPDRRKIVAASSGGIYWWGLELFDFNPATGIVSNDQVLEYYPAGRSYYGAEFSPDNSKLYTGSYKIQQWNVSLPTTAAIIASKKDASGPAANASELKLGPDGKIYVSCPSTNTIGCIKFPNADGLACDFIPDAVNISPDTTALGLPNTVWSAQSILGFYLLDTGTTTTLITPSPGGSWSSSDTTKVKVSSSGVVTTLGYGTATIYYTLPSGCKMSAVFNIVKDASAPTLYGTWAKPTLYPNPATNEITITADPSTFTSFTIYNALGQELIKSEITNTKTKVDVKALPPGQYLVVFKGDAQPEMLRFVKW